MKKIGIIGAMELEVETLKAHMTTTNITTKANMEFHEGTLNGTPVVIVRSGVGKVNAALCVQILADLFQVTAIINTGVAGSLNAALDIGDILISKDALHHLIEVAASTCQKVNPDIHVHTGRVVSGDQFISSKEVKDRLIKEFQGDCAEMEGASIAHGAYLNGIPFVIIRAISDKADDSAEMDYPTFEKAAALHSAKLVEAMMPRI